MQIAHSSLPKYFLVLDFLGRFADVPPASTSSKAIVPWSIGPIGAFDPLLPAAWIVSSMAGGVGMSLAEMDGGAGMLGCANSWPSGTPLIPTAASILE